MPQQPTGNSSLAVAQHEQHLGHYPRRGGEAGNGSATRIAALDASGQAAGCTASSLSRPSGGPRRRPQAVAEAEESRPWPVAGIQIPNADLSRAAAAQSLSACPSTGQANADKDDHDGRTHRLRDERRRRSDRSRGRPAVRRPGFRLARHGEVDRHRLHGGHRDGGQGARRHGEHVPRGREVFERGGIHRRHEGRRRLQHLQGSTASRFPGSRWEYAQIALPPLQDAARPARKS